MDIGDARVSTGERTLDLQRAALPQAGCRTICEGTASGAKAERRVLEPVLGDLREGTHQSSGGSIGWGAP